MLRYNISYNWIKAAYTKYGYKFYDSGKYNVNLFAIRSKDPEVDKFNDLIGVAYRDAFMNKHCLVFSGTTKPGLTYLKDKLGNPEGTGILVPGFYPKCWIIGVHNAGTAHAHEAYRQSAPGVFRVWRDRNSDGRLDYSGKVYTDVSGLNGHTTREFDIVHVGGFSAACQVVQDDKEHAIWVSVGKRSAELYGNSFSYALFDQK